MTDDKALDLSAEVLVRLLSRHIPGDVVDLLMFGDGRGNIPPGALAYALKPLVDALEAAEARALAAETARDVATETQNEATEYAVNADLRREAAEREKAELREALEPFAKASDLFSDHQSDVGFAGSWVTSAQWEVDLLPRIGMFRRARSTLSRIEDKK